MSPNAYFFYRGLAGFLSERVGEEVRWIDPGDWREGLRMIREGEVSLAAICGLQYVEEVDAGRAKIAPLFAPVHGGEIYGGRPVYFTEVLVAAGSEYQSFEDLAEAHWAYNEPTSHSGYGIMAYELVRRGLTFDFFGVCVESGSHLDSLGMLLAGSTDAITIDSTVLDLEFARSPGLRNAVRSVARLGPSPAPPTVVSDRVPSAMKARLLDAISSFGGDRRERVLLREAMLERLAPVTDGDYNEIRRTREVAGAAGAPATTVRDGQSARSTGHAG